MSRIAKRIASGILVLAFVAGSVKFGSLAVELQEKQREWAEIESEASLPLPAPRFNNVRCEPGDRPNHWIVTMRYRESYQAFFHHSFDRFHLSKLKFVGGLHNLERVQLGVGKWEDRPSLSIPAGGSAEFEIRIQESSLGNTLVCYRGIDVRFPCVTNTGGIQTAPTNIDQLSIRFPIARSTATQPVDEPLRLFDFAPMDEYASDEREQVIGELW
ncbi:MAG: hypothetical protein AAGI63_05185 [Planctomycetota bacterium]